MGTAVNVIIAVVAAALIMRTGMRLLGGFSQPMAEPPPAGELRKVKLMYRCEICGAEVRMTIAPHEDPDPPRHCMDEMSLVTPVE